MSDPGPQHQDWTADAADAERKPGRGRCLLVASNFPPLHGGSSTVYDSLCRFSEGALVALAPQRNYSDGSEFADWRRHDQTAPYTVYRLPLLRPKMGEPAPRITSFGRLLFDDAPLVFRVLQEIRRIAKKEKIDTLCIGELVYGGGIAVLSRLFLGLKIIYYIHGEEISSIGREGISSGLRQFFLRFADGAVAVSQFTRSLLIERMGVADNRIETIFNGVDLARFHPQPKSQALLRTYRVPAGRTVLLSVCRLVERKGVDNVLRALAQLLAGRGDLHYLIVGDGPYRARLEQIVGALNIRDHVTFAGEVGDDELAAHYALGDLFVLPNRALPNGDTEGFGLVFLEANACGKPVIAGKAGGVPDAVQNGFNGLLVDGENIDAIASAIAKVVDDPALYESLAANALVAAGRSDWLSRTNQFLRFLERVQSGKVKKAEADLRSDPRHFRQGGAAPRRAASSPRLPQPARSDLIRFPTGERPSLAVIVDAEEEFDWGTYSRQSNSVRTIRLQTTVHRIFEKYGIVPTYAVDHPVATQPDGVKPLLELLQDGQCEIGAQLHSWVTPPFEEEDFPRSTFSCNLPAALEFAKMKRLTAAIEEGFGVRPTLFRAGRYGFGPNAIEALPRLGYEIDCSVLPWRDLRPRGGPDFHDFGASPFWLDRKSGFIELPVTVGMVGLLDRIGATGGLWPIIDSPLGERFHLPGMLAHAGLASRIPLTPEGTTLAEAKMVTRWLLDQGERYFCVTYHSPSLEPGHTPYVRNQAELRTMLDWIEGYLDFFFGEIGGQAATPAQIRRQAMRLAGMADLAPAALAG